MPSTLRKKRAQNKKYYKDHKEKLLLQACQSYVANSDFKKHATKQYFLFFSNINLESSSVHLSLSSNCSDVKDEHLMLLTQRVSP